MSVLVSIDLIDIIIPLPKYLITSLNAIEEHSHPLPLLYMQTA